MSLRISNNNANMSADDAENLAAQGNLLRKCVDFHGPAVLDISARLYRPRQPYLQPHAAWLARAGSLTSMAPTSLFCTYLAHIARAKSGAVAVHCCGWTPGGRRLLTGNHEGDFTLWDGVHFGYELMLSAHDQAFRALTWSRNSNYLLTSDASGNIKYWSPSIAPVHSIDAHGGSPVHALSFSPADTKFASGGDDGVVRIWDWATHTEERVLEGHGWDVKTCDWHPRSSVVASGSKDNVVKLWDPRVGGEASGCLHTLYGHKNTVTQLSWNTNGNWLLTASRDQLIKLYDIRAMRELTTFKGHFKEVTSLAWHPSCQTVFCSGGMDGTLIFWNVGPKGSEEPGAKIPFAHDMAIWDMKWHPAGHMLATVSNDQQTKFWARNRLGSTAGLTASSGAPSGDAAAEDQDNLLTHEIELGNHVGIVIGKKGATIIGMQRSTGTKMNVDQGRRTLVISGTARQIEVVKRRVGALLERVTNEDAQRGMMMN